MGVGGLDRGHREREAHGIMGRLWIGSCNKALFISILKGDSLPLLPFLPQSRKTCECRHKYTAL